MNATRAALATGGGTGIGAATAEGPAALADCLRKAAKAGRRPNQTVAGGSAKLEGGASMVRIRLRPYHPTYVIAHYGSSVPEGSRARGTFEEIQRKLRENPLHEIEIELVQEHDDACAGCKFRREAEGGSVWGERHTCVSAEDPQVVAAVNRTNEKVFRLLGLGYGSVIRLPELVRLLADRIPVLDDGMLGGMSFQEAYQKGLEALAERASWTAERQGEGAPNEQQGRPMD